MDVDAGFAQYTVEVSNIAYRATRDDLERRLLPLLNGVCSIAHTQRSGKATVEFTSRAHAEAAVRQISQVRDSLAYSPQGQNRSLKAQLVGTGAAGSALFTQTEEAQRWRYVDTTALPQEEQQRNNEADTKALFDKLEDGPMKDSIWALVLRLQRDEQRVFKEMYLHLGRSCELVFAGSRGQKDTYIPRSTECVVQAHLDEFISLFAELPEAARRTGIDSTLHRIARVIHAVTKKPCAITARVGRTIQGSVLPMLIDSSATEPVEALADLCKHGLMIVGKPNVGKTTVLRELARLLSSGDRRVVVVVDKSLEIAGTGVVPHKAIGNARVLTVDDPEHQARVMIEAVENQSPDIVIVDELSNRAECNAARTIAGRGCAIIATVHGEGLESILNDNDRSLLVGGVTSVTLSAREAEARADKLRQVQKRANSVVFGAAVELRGYHDWIVHDDLESAVDKYLDHRPFSASWRQLDGEEVTSTPLAGCRQSGSAVGFGYALLRRGESVGAGDGVDFGAADPVSGQKLWTETAPSARIYERTQRGGGGGGGAARGGFNFGGATPGGGGGGQ
tara:strand:+ start:156 stop:1850 length:1695 start_codon:yes stop_codon:yes gene_type:complete